MPANSAAPGLGLAISKRLVETMGGEIGVEPGPEGGSCLLVHPAVAGGREPRR